MSQKVSHQLPAAAYLLVMGFALFVFFGRADATLLGIYTASAKTLMTGVLMGGFTLSLIYLREWRAERRTENA